MRYLPNPKRIQFELSNVCNLHCLGCIRTDNTLNSVKSVIGDPRYLSIDTFNKIIIDDELSSVKDLDFCGRIDDPLAHPDFLKILEISTAQKRFKIFIHTNGSLRNPGYWKKIGNQLKETDHVVMFNIDGLEDTNHIYRQGSVWSNIIENVKSYISTGANADWQFIEFPWNRHQIQDAMKLSKELGFKQFAVRQDRSRIQGKSLEHIIHIKKENNKLMNSKFDLEFLSNPRYKIESDIQCMNKMDSMYFIDHMGKLWPCCFIPNGFIEDDGNIVSKDFLKKRIYGAYNDITWNDCNLHSISSIVNHKFYDEDLVASWDSKTHGTGTKDRIFRCTETCSSKSLSIKPATKTTIKKFSHD
jgi:MoaA/NifB/PqqE/SkfB family radical SAM enzyme